jgi:hypothetical protein
MMKECCDHIVIMLNLNMIGLWFIRYAISDKLKKIETNYKEKKLCIL